MLGIYCRISRSKEEGKDRSIPNQMKLGKQLAKRLNVPFKVYVDEGFSGTLENIEDRPQFELLLSDIVEGTVTKVFAYDQSRLERNPQVRHLITNIFKEHDVEYFTEIDGKVDLHDPQAEFFGDIQSVINKYHVTITKLKVASVLKQRASEGKAHGILPYGYAKDDAGMLVVDEREAEVVKKIFQLSLSGVGTRSIAEKLNSQGVKTRYNKIGVGSLTVKNKYTGDTTTIDKSKIKWSGNTIRNIITNTIYYGDRVYGGNVYKVPAIIDKSFWKDVNDNLKNNTNNRGKKVVHQYLLKGLLRCGRCGRNLYGRTRENKKDHYYMCSSKRIKGENCGLRSIHIDRIEEFVWNRIIRNGHLEKELEKYFSQDDNRISDIKAKLDESTNKLKALNNEKNKAVSLIIKGVISEEDAEATLNGIKSKIEQLEYLIADYNNQLGSLHEGARILKAFQADFYGITDATSFLEKKELIGKFIRNIKVEFIEGVGSTLYQKKEYESKYQFYKLTIDYTMMPKSEVFVNGYNLDLRTWYRRELIEEGDGKQVIFSYEVEPFTMRKEDNTMLPIKEVAFQTFPAGDGTTECYPVFDTLVPHGHVDSWEEDEVEEYYGLDEYIKRKVELEQKLNPHI